MSTPIAPLVRKAATGTTFGTASYSVASEAAMTALDPVGSPLQGGTLIYIEGVSGASLNELWVLNRFSAAGAGATVIVAPNGGRFLKLV